MQASELMKQEKRGIQASCGCRRNQSISDKNRKHGMSLHDAYAVYRSMIDRCRLPTHQAWDRYGGRGIEVCARWRESFANFWEDMGPTYEKGLTLDRVENNGNYEKGNCRWTSRTRQARNTRANVLVETPWGRMTAAEAADRAGIKRTTFYYRVSIGVTGPDLFTPPDVTRRFTT